MRKLQHERNARELQEQINSEQSKFREALQQEKSPEQVCGLYHLPVETIGHVSHPGGNYWDYYPDATQVMETHFNIVNLSTKSSGTQSSNEF